MHRSVWVALLRHLPPELHDQIMLVTVGGTEIAIGGLLRIDREFVAIKGRLAGSQEMGRVFFIPFDHIDYFGFQKPLRETEFHELFDSLTIPDGEATGSLPPAEEPAIFAEPAPTAPAGAGAPAAPPGQAPSAPPSYARLPIKSAVLERFRARSNGSSGTSE
jgi:hypothetical protein